MKEKLFALILTLALCFFPAVKGHGVVIDEYGELFNAVLNNMMDNYTWQLDDEGNPIVGNWGEDEMYDSTLFAPDILYRLASDPDYGDETARARAFTLADQTVAYEMDALVRYILGDETMMLEAFAGAPCLIDAYAAKGDLIYSVILTAALTIVKGIVAEEPNFLGDYMGYVCANGLVGYYGLSFGDVEKKIAGLIAQNIGLEVLDAAVARYWVEADGRFWPIYNLYEDGWMLMGLAYAYGITGDEQYKTMADLVMIEIDTRLWDDESPSGGYWEYEPYLFKPSLGHWKKLSTHERIARAMLHWYEVTGDAGYLDQARKMLDYTRDNLCTEDLNQPGRTICYHHWTEVTGLPHAISDENDPGYDPYYPHPFCTGCNFNLLIDIYLLNKFVQESEQYPRPVGACGQIVSARNAAPAEASAGLAVLGLPGLLIVLLKRRAKGLY